MPHANAPLTVEGRRRLVERCKTRPIAPRVAAEKGISRACASKWVNRYRRYGDLGLLDRSSTPHHQPTATPDDVVAQIEVGVASSTPTKTRTGNLDRSSPVDRAT